MVQRGSAIFGVGQAVRVANASMVAVARRVAPSLLNQPTITASGSLSGTAFRIGTARTITAGVATASGGGDISYQFRWLVDGVIVATTDAYTPLAGNDGDPIVAQWRAIETGGASPGQTEWQTVGSGTIAFNPPDFATQPAFGAGSYTVGQTVTFTEGLAGASATLTIEEFRLGAVDKRDELFGTSWNTAGETSGIITLRVRATNSGGSVLSNAITVTLAEPSELPDVIYNSGSGWTLQILSEDESGDLTFTITIAGTPLGPFTRTEAQQASGAAVNHIAPVIAETAPAGTYAATVGLWTHGLTPDPTATYQWRRDGVAISGATAATYAKVGADDGTTLTCAVTFAGVTAVSNGIAIPAPSAGITVTAATDGITFTSTSDLAVSGATDGITVTET